MEPRDYSKPKLGNLNGYRYFYDPQHPLSFGVGCVYDHRHEASVKLGRWLRAGEVVHHKDGDRANNEHENLEVTTKSDHARHHACENGGVSPTEKLCPVCGRSFSVPRSGQVFCSNSCRGVSVRRVKWPSKRTLQKDLEHLSREAVGRKYGVSGNTIRKWARRRGLL